MKVALLSDIHGNLPALQAVLADLRMQGVQHVVNLGDSLSGPLLPLETAQFLMQQNWHTLAGNHERQLLNLPLERMGASDAYTRACLPPSVLDWLRHLPASLRLDWQPGLPVSSRQTPDVLLCHGTPYSDTQYFLDTVSDGRTRMASLVQVRQRLGDETAALVACGHTHLPRVLQISSGQTLLNPGSVGLPAYADDGLAPHVVENGSPHARYAIAERQPHEGGWRIALCAVPYEHEIMARLADRNGRPDWAHALRTGVMPPRA